MQFVNDLMKKNSERSIFGQNLIKLRKARGLTQPELASALEVSRDTIAYYETRAKNPTSEFIEKVSDFFCVEYNELLTSRNKSKTTQILKKQLEQVKNLSKKDQEAISKMIDSLTKKSGKK